MKTKNSLQQVRKAALLASSIVTICLSSADIAAAELEEVIVTAQKRMQSQQDVPVSVTTLSEENMSAVTSGGASVIALAGRLPSLNVENSSFGRIFPRAYIRGLGNTDFDLNASQPVSYIYDEVVFENPILKGFPAFDIDQLEVLRGPQGTLFGRNTPAGILKFDSKKPTHERDGYAKVGYGRFNQRDAEGAIGGSLVDDVLAFRFSFKYGNRDNWIDNGLTGKRDFQGGYEDSAARLQFLWTPGQDFSALFNFHSHILNSSEGGFRANILETGSNSLVSGFERDKVFIDGINDQKLNHTGTTLKLEYDFDTMTLTSISGFETLDLRTRGDVDGGSPAGPGFIPFPAETQDEIPDLDQFTQEIRLSSEHIDNFKWQAGLFYFSEEFQITSVSFDVLGDGSVNGSAVQDAETSAWAAFAHIDWDVSDTFTFSAGLRYSDDSKKFTAERFQSPIVFPGSVLAGFGPSGEISVEPEDNVVSWDLSGIYTFNDDVNFYARVAKGFRAPSIQGRILFANGTSGVTIGDTETILSYEAGIKSELLDRSLRLNMTTYYFELEDQQLTATGGDTNINRLVNAHETEGYGFETDLTYLPTENWLITAGFSFNHTEINDSQLAITPCAAACTVLDPLNASGSALLNGNSLVNAPEWIANLTVRYSVPLASGELYFLTDWTYLDETNLFLYESTEFTTEERVEGGVRLGYITSDEIYEVALYGRNILNEEYLAGGVDFNNLAGTVNAPAFWGVEFRANFF
jgi:iron complex outermembrane recepter protein